MSGLNSGRGNFLLLCKFPDHNLAGEGIHTIVGNTPRWMVWTGHSHNMSANFSGDATSVVQPYLALIYIIKT